MTGRDFWLARLRPFAQDYHRGVVDHLEVVLFDDVGNEVHIPRPSADGWHVPVLPSLDHNSDIDPEARRGVLYLMRSGDDRMELAV